MTDLTPESRVSVPLKVLGGLLVAGLSALGGLLWRYHASMWDGFAGLHQRLGVVEVDVKRLNPSTVRDACREVFLEEIRKTAWEWCPARGRCRVVTFIEPERRER